MRIVAKQILNGNVFAADINVNVLGVNIMFFRQFQGIEYPFDDDAQSVVVFGHNGINRFKGD